MSKVIRNLTCSHLAMSHQPIPHLSAIIQKFKITLVELFFNYLL